MAAVKIANLTETKPGHFFFVKKIRGHRSYTPLPMPTDPKFAAAYAKAKAKYDRLSKPIEIDDSGTFKALIAEYRKSSDYLVKLTEKTRLNYDGYLDMIEAKMGAAPVKDLKTSRIEKIRDEMQDTPGKANNWLKVLRTILDLAIRRDYVETNAADKVKMLEIGEHQPWPQEVLDRFLAACPTQTTRLAVLTGLYSGQRIGDVIRITHKMMEGDTVHLVQGKKRSKGKREIEVFIPIHPKWRQAVAAIPRRADTIIYDRYGRTFKDPGGLQERISDLMKLLGYKDDKGQALYTFHGLRKNAANYLKEMELTDAQIGAICGMSSDTVALYTRGVQKRVLAEKARERVVSGDVTRQASGLTGVETGTNSRSSKTKKIK